MTDKKDDRTTWERQELLQWSNHRDWSLRYLSEFAKNVPISRLQNIINDRFEKLGKELPVREDQDRQQYYNDLASFFEYEEIKALFPVPPPLPDPLRSFLSALNGDLLQQNDCYLGGEAAVCLQYGEHSNTDHLLFFCGSKDGFRELITVLAKQGPYPLFKHGNVQVFREPKAGMHSVLMALGDEGNPVVLEFRHESRMEIRGKRDREYDLPVLSVEDLFAEKLLEKLEAFKLGKRSQADKDLDAMVESWGLIPDAAMEKARSVYGDLIDEICQSAHEENDSFTNAFRKARGRIPDDIDLE